MKRRSSRWFPPRSPDSREVIDARSELWLATQCVEKTALAYRRASPRDTETARHHQDLAALNWASALVAVLEHDHRVAGGPAGSFLSSIQPVEQGDRRRKIAFHEAGRSSVAMFLGLEITSATIGSDIFEGPMGRVRKSGVRSRHVPSDLEAEIVVEFAGHYAACRRFPDQMPDGFADDFARARAGIAVLAKGKSARRMLGLERNLRDRSLWLVDHIWPAIAALAERLDQEDTVGARGIVAAFGYIPPQARLELLDHPWAGRGGRLCLEVVADDQRKCA